jgi:hypothetical protein
MNRPNRVVVVLPRLGGFARLLISISLSIGLVSAIEALHDATYSPITVRLLEITKHTEEGVRRGSLRECFSVKYVANTDVEQMEKAIHTNATTATLYTSECESQKWFIPYLDELQNRFERDKHTADVLVPGWVKRSDARQLALFRAGMFGQTTQMVIAMLLVFLIDLVLAKLKALDRIYIHIRRIFHRQP